MIDAIEERPGTARGLAAAVELGLRIAAEPTRPLPPWPRLAVSLCRALGRHAPGQPEVERALIAALGDPAAEVAAAVALQDAGSVAAVPALSEAAERVGLLDSRGLKAACQQAISAIQARAVGSPGSLSIAGRQEQAGQLSEAEPRRSRGGLSEPER